MPISADTEQLYTRVNSMIKDDGISRRDAFRRIAKEMGRGEGTVSTTYYRAQRAFEENGAKKTAAAKKPKRAAARKTAAKKPAVKRAAVKRAPAKRTPVRAAAAPATATKRPAARKAPARRSTRTRGASSATSSAQFFRYVETIERKAAQLEQENATLKRRLSAVTSALRT